MKWIKRQDNFSAEHFSLLKNDSVVLDLKFNLHTNTARVECGGNKRAFMIEEGGLFRNSVVFRNEYGIEIGYLHFENTNGTEGFVQMEDEKFNFTINSDAQSKITFFIDDSPAPAGTCLLPEKNAFNFSRNNGSAKTPLRSALLLVMGWYFYQPLLRTADVV